jgi:hypothetical protein
MIRSLVALALVALLAPPGAATEAIIATPERCAQLIALFDEIIISRWDHRLLKLEAHELAEARRWRRQAEVECGRGEYWFGVRAIEDALNRIGVLPPSDDDPPAK